MILIVVILMDLLAGMEFDLFVPGFPQIQDHFQLSASWVELLLSVNFIGYCISLFLIGELADYFGRKPIILYGLILFIVGSMLCLWAPSYSLLLCGRFLQGIGIAAPSILSFLIVADFYPLKEQQFFMAMLNAVINASVAIAPVAGSYITLYFQWQGNFMVLLLLGIAVLVMTLLFIPTYKPPAQKEKFSLRGYFPLFRSKSLMLLMANIIGTYVPYWIFVGMSPLLYMKDLGVSLSHFGYYQGALALIFSLGSLLFGFMMHRYDPKKMLRFSNTICMISFISITFVTFFKSASALLITLAFLPFIISQITPSILLAPVCLNFVPSAKGKVSAILQGFRLLIVSFSLQIAGHFYVGSFQPIGILILSVITITIITLFLVMKNNEITDRLSHDTHQ
jgi:DHA1 family bicyclomycin/chloramphenicol resistance-like MFS transporter